MPSPALAALVNGLVDYAGLFPPAKLDMKNAVEAFARARRGPHAFGLARFICPVSRLGEFAKAAAAHLPNADAIPAHARATKGKAAAATGVVERSTGPVPASPGDPWTLSALIDGPLAANIKVIDEFNAAHFRNHHHSAVVDTVEIKVTSADAIDAALEVLPEELNPFFELPLKGDLRACAAALAGMGANAKIRTGGVTPDLFPSVEEIADFLLVMADSKIAFKATAGLHHPVRSAHALTYEPGAPTAVMHGFVNLFLAAAFVVEQGIDRATVTHLLGETVAESFELEPAVISWRGLRIDAQALARARENFALCFGSCSFDEPMADLRTMRWLAP
ncbi:MAG: hypothetical protein ACT4PL_07540 [Phycisphaerales bacterium]